MIATLRVAIAALVGFAILAQLTALPAPAAHISAGAGRVAGTTHVAFVKPARIIVPDPPRRLPPPSLPAASVRAKKTANVVFRAGSRVHEPPMLSPAEAGRRAASVMSRGRAHLPQRTPLAAPQTDSLRPMDVSTPLPVSGTGINHWWRYQEENVPGGGHLLVNIGTGNMLLQNDDLSVPHKGVGLAFRRTYNSQSTHDVNGTDGGPPGLFGNGWTNTFDAHVHKTSVGHYSVYDIDGARYDYHVPGGLTANVPFISDSPGQHAQLIWDGGCDFLWTKKTGTTYDFFADRPNSSCAALDPVGAYAGRIHQIVGRNTNTYVAFSYAWVGGNAGIGGIPSQIVVTTESGMSTTLTFASFSGHQLLQTLQAPDASVTTYSYDAAGNLTDVDSPPNNANGTRVHRQYGYYTSGALTAMQWASSPRWYNTNGTDGSWVGFMYAGGTAPGNADIWWVEHDGYVNPAPNDGTSTPLQPNYSNGYTKYFYESYTTATTNGTYRDSDGHFTNWVFDSQARPIQLQECTSTTLQQVPDFACTGTYLVSNNSWDADNNLIATVDPRGDQTDYAYDTAGNAVAIAQPAPSIGAFRPTRLLSYDAYNNITASCDPVAAHALGADWSGPPPPPSPGHGLCPENSSTATRMQWSSANPPAQPGVAAEPYGELQSITGPATSAAPSGYVHTFMYDALRQGGTDFGLPTSVVGGPTGDGSRQARADFWYDSNGNLLCSGNGSGQWLLAYDGMGRLTKAADPDDSVSGGGICGRTGMQPGWNTTARTTYYADGSVASKQTALEAVNGIGTTFTYDLDGNVITETHRYGCLSTASCTTGVTNKWYDGADRLVEVQKPYDGSDVQGYPWSTRYLYDLSQGHVSTYRGMGLAGYGNLVSTQELLSGTVWTPTPGQTLALSTGAWTDVRATSYDALDRPLSSYEAAFGDQPKTTNAYDGPGAAGLLSSVRLATTELKSLTYDNAGRQTDVSYAFGSNVTPATHQEYDADGRVTSRTTSVLGTETIALDATGAVTNVTEPAALGGGTISYAYYADGLRSRAGYSDAMQSYANAMRYAYRADGKRVRVTLGNGSAFAWAYTTAGRLQTQSDPLTGTTVHPDATYMANKFEKPYYPATVTYGPWTQTYDAYGRAAVTTLPVSLFSYTGTQYDLEGGIAALTASGYAPSPANPNYATSGPIPLQQSTIRNEKNPGTNPPGSPSGWVSAVPTVQVNGTWLSMKGARRSMGSVQNWTIDSRSGMLLHNVGTNSGATEGVSYAYDNSGRLVQDFEGASESLSSTSSPTAHFTYTQNWCPEILVGTPGHPSVRCYTNGSRSKTYDAENRLRTETFDYQPEISPGGGPTYTTTSYGFAQIGAYWEDTSGYGQPANIQAVDYGATSHPMRIALYHPDLNPNSASETRAWLWDGSDRFIECQLTNGQCQNPSLSIEGLGDYDLAHGTLTRVNDRGRTGGITMSRTAVAFSGWADAPTMIAKAPVYAPCSTSSGAVGTYGNPSICMLQHDGKLTADGWTLDYETWQGSRSSDLNVGQWNTPDAYGGDVADPMSQKPFMWNGNNPYAYSDPSGYLIKWEGTTEQQMTAQENYQAAIDYFTNAGDAEAAHKLELLRSDPSFTINVIVTATGRGRDIVDVGGSGEVTLRWDARQGLIVDDYDPSASQSPAMGLLHEADHALRAASDPTAFLRDASTVDATYDTKEEARVIRGTEHTSANRVHEPARWNHGGMPCITTSVGSTNCR